MGAPKFLLPEHAWFSTDATKEFYKDLFHAKNTNNRFVYADVADAIFILKRFIDKIYSVFSVVPTHIIRKDTGLFVKSGSIENEIENLFGSFNETTAFYGQRMFQCYSPHLPDGAVAAVTVRSVSPALYPNDFGFAVHDDGSGKCMPTFGVGSIPVGDANMIMLPATASGNNSLTAAITKNQCYLKCSCGKTVSSIAGGSDVIEDDACWIYTGHKCIK